MFERIEAARERLSGYANRTPVMTSRTIDQLVNAKVFFKCENFQRTGAFKFRGAFNAISQLSDEEKARGVITYSSGNHAQAVALVGRILKIRTVVVMPIDAPIGKRSAAEGYGAAVVEHDPRKTSREEVAGALAKEHGYTMVPPFDEPDVIAGQGTASLELFEEVGSLDQLLIPCGGGGLLSGSAIATKGVCPDCAVIGIEPEAADDATRSFQAKSLHRADNPPTIADGLRTPSLGTITFPLVLKYVDDMKTVSEEAIAEAVKFLFHRMKLVVEPSGALGLSALLSGRLLPGNRVGVILSGGNVDGATMSRILNGVL